jgi:uncharacterized membrane protein YedE/YeeE
MRRILIPFVSGGLFGIGLALSGMTDTRIVLGFLDIAGAWNPALLFVMLGAIALTMPAFYFILKRPSPLVAQQFHVPTKTTLDARLLVGSAIFGIGWGLYGYCPGPALAALSGFHTEPWLFVIAMAVGIFFAKNRGQ